MPTLQKIVVFVAPSSVRAPQVDRLARARARRAIADWRRCLIEARRRRVRALPSLKEPFTAWRALAARRRTARAAPPPPPRRRALREASSAPPPPRPFKVGVVDLVHLRAR